MNLAQFHLLDGPDYFLRPSLRGKIVTLTFGEYQSIKHLVEPLGLELPMASPSMSHWTRACSL